MPTPAHPTGTPRNWTREALAILLLVDDDDLDGSRQLWKSHAPSGYAGILDNAGFTWDGQAQLYTARHGRKVDGHMMKRLGVTVAASVGLEMQDAAKEMAEGKTDIGTWQDEQAKRTKELYLALMGLAAGGVDAISEGDQTRLASMEAPGLGFTLDRLNSFASDAAAGTMTEDEIVQRAGLYAQTANGVYEDERTASHQRAEGGDGKPLYLFERNILGDPRTEHCSECPELSALGWKKIGTLTAIGLRECLFNCLCSMEYSLTGDDSL